jgi:hypothetical protein
VLPSNVDDPGSPPERSIASASSFNSKTWLPPVNPIIRNAVLYISNALILSCVPAVSDDTGNSAV